MQFARLVFTRTKKQSFFRGQSDRMQPWGCRIWTSEPTHVLKQSYTQEVGANLYAGTITRKKAILLTGVVGLERTQGQYAKRMRAFPSDARCFWTDPNGLELTTPLSGRVHPWGFVAIHECARPCARCTVLRVSPLPDHTFRWETTSSNPLHAVTACTAPIWSAPRGVDMHTWLTLNMRRHVTHFALYVRSELMEDYAALLKWYIDSKLVTLHDIGPLRTPRGVSAHNRTENYDPADVELHREYGDQIFWLNHCLHTYGFRSRWLLSVDLDEVLTGGAEGLSALDEAHPWRLQTVAYGGPPHAPCHDRDAMQPFTATFQYRQATPIKEGWPRTKIMIPGKRASFLWIHDIFDTKDTCEGAQTVSEHKLVLAHYVDKEAASIIHGNRCRCSRIDASLPCDTHDAALAALLRQGAEHAPPRRLLAYVEHDGMNNQLIALRHACWLAKLTDRSVLVHDHILPHLTDTIPFQRAGLCSLIDCHHLERHCGVGVVWTSHLALLGRDVASCSGEDCYERDARNATLYVPHKVAFQLGLQPSSYAFPKKVQHMVDPVRPILEAAPPPFQHTRYNMLHLRLYSAYDRPYTPSIHTFATRKKILSRITAIDNTYPWYVISSNHKRCTRSKLVRSMHLIGMNATCVPNDASVHRDRDCMTQQVLAVRSERFVGDPHSTMSQNILRWRKDAKCSPSWCDDG